VNWADNTAILNKLPTTYSRLGPNFDIWKNSQLAVLTRFTEAADSISAQYSYSGATGNWLNAWGELFGVTRSTEYDALFKLCITFTMLAWRGTVPGIERYMNEARGIPSTVIENFPNVGWQLTVYPGYTLTPAQIALLPGWLAFVRPAGVPYTVKANSGGGYLSTGNFLSVTRFPGSWLRLAGSTPEGFEVPMATNNTVPLLPTTLLTDPLLNPGLSSVAL
jgi:hypothetical protein